MKVFKEINKILLNMEISEQIPLIACINLYSREDRFIHMKNQFKNNNIKNVHFLRVDKHPKGGSIGCFDSHLQIYRYCIQNNKKYALIFEDDIQINSKNIKNTINKFLYIIKKYPSWYKVNCHDWGVYNVNEHIKNGIYKASGVGNCCYFISLTAMKKAFQKGITTTNVDLQQLFDFPSDKVFYITPSLTNILSMGSDNESWGQNIGAKICFLLQKETNLLPFIFRIQQYFNFKLYYIPIYSKLFMSTDFLRKEYEEHNREKLNIEINNDKIFIPENECKRIYENKKIKNTIFIYFSIFIFIIWLCKIFVL